MHVQSIDKSMISNAHSLMSAQNMGKTTRHAEKHHAVHDKSHKTKAHEHGDSHDSDNTGRAKGVLSLLEAGHFKGVAAVRLQINFFDELTARAATRAADAAQTGANDLVDSLSAVAKSELSSFADTPEKQAALDDLLKQFGDTVQSAVGDSAKGTASNSSSLDKTFTDAFEALISGIQTLLQPPADPTDSEPGDTPTTTDLSPSDPAATNLATGEAPLAGDVNDTVGGVADIVPPASTDVSVSATGDLVPGRDSGANATSTDTVQVGADPATETEHSALDVALTNLREVFAAALKDFSAAVKQAGALPALPPPPGHGSAYQKFFNILQSLKEAWSGLDVQV